jgi:hypothetical protein
MESIRVSGAEMRLGMSARHGKVKRDTCVGYSRRPTSHDGLQGICTRPGRVRPVNEKRLHAELANIDASVDETPALLALSGTAAVTGPSSGANAVRPAVCARTPDRGTTDTSRPLALGGMRSADSLSNRCACHPTSTA